MRARWLGLISYREALDLQRSLFEARVSGLVPDYLILQEHTPVFTLGRRAKREHLLLSMNEMSKLGVEVIDTDRGGDITYHGPGQLVAYPIVKIDRLDVKEWVSVLESAVVNVAGGYGVEAHTDPRFPGVWVGQNKLAAIGVRISRNVTTHGLALNVSTDLSRFDAIVPCGIRDRGVTSLESECGTGPLMKDVVTDLTRELGELIGSSEVELEAAPWPRGDARREAEEPSRKLDVRRDRRPRAANGTLRPASMRATAKIGAGYNSVRSIVRGAALNTVCEEAKCPNIYECWSQRTATFMILGDQCTRACGFCNVATGRPGAVDPGEPTRVADAASMMDLSHVVITSVARDDLPDGGASAFATTIEAVRAARPECSTEVLIPDFGGDARSLDRVLAAEPDVLNHNIETVPRLQRKVRPSAGYARSLALLARVKQSAPEIATKSGLMVGLGEVHHEVLATIEDLVAVGVSIFTAGQYLQPTPGHLRVERWWSSDEFDEVKRAAEGAGFEAVVVGPLARSSYRAHTALAGVERMAASTVQHLQVR